MVVLGIDAHKRTHTVVAVDQHGKKVGHKTVAATSEGHLELLRWAGQFGERRFAVEDCRHVSRRLEKDLIVAGEYLVRVPTKLMAGSRRSVRVARASLREENLAVAQLDGPERVARLLADHREDLVNERTWAQNRLRWHLHELDPTLELAAGCLDRYVVLKTSRGECSRGRPSAHSDDFVHPVRSFRTRGVGGRVAADAWDLSR